MKILRNYTLSECILPFVLSLGVLTCVFLLGNLIQLTHLVINKGVSLITVCKVFALYVPVLLGYTLPIACLISIILGFSRLSADNEVLAIRACGVYLRKLLKPLIIVGLVFSLFLFLLNDRIIPYAHHEQRKMLKTLAVKKPTAKKSTVKKKATTKKTTKKATKKTEKEASEGAKKPSKKAKTTPKKKTED